MTDYRVEDFLRGSAWPGNPSVPYPRADPADASRLPGDTWDVAKLPVGVRLELTGDATVIEVDYTCATDDLGYRGDGAGRSFAVWHGDKKIVATQAHRGEGTAVLELPAHSDDAVLVVHLPEGMRPALTALRATGGTIRPVEPGPRWLAYGDSITEGWVASEPGLAWPAIVARRTGLDVVNLGYAGACRGEIASAEQLSVLPADVISVFYGTNCWSRTPHSAELLGAGFRAFMEVLRQGHPSTPVIVVSQLVRPDAESTPNRLGATMQDLRSVIEQAVTAAEDPHLTLIRGGDLVDGDLLPDGIHPGDEAQWILADAIGSEVLKASQS